MRKKLSKNYKVNRKLYHNKVFSYKYCNLLNKNYSRKNFANTYSKSVTFENCIFEETIFSEMKFKSCSFINCKFKKIEFFNVAFENIKFEGCSFIDILFNKCNFISILLENNFWENVSINPYIKIHSMITSKPIKKQISSELNKILEKAKLHKYIRESNTILKKVHNRFPNKLKTQLKKISKKEGKKLGLTNKQRLQENYKRKLQKNKLLKESYEKSQRGENIQIDKGILDFLLSKYSEEDLIKGFEYSINNINTPFHQFSFLLRYIEKGIRM